VDERGRKCGKTLCNTSLPGFIDAQKVFCRPLNLGESECLSGDALAGFLSDATLASENGIMVSAVTVLGGGETLWRGAQVFIRRFEGPCRALAPQRVILVSAYAQREGYTVAGTIQKPDIALSKA
jgi:hypothetical protein